MQVNLPDCWRHELLPVIESAEFGQLAQFVDNERAAHDVYPAARHVFRAFSLTPFDETRVVILGQDPYHGPEQAHGLAFSVPSDTRLPPSLVNIYKELKSDIGRGTPRDGCLDRWARQGVLLLNTVLSVRAGKAHSHRRRGWEELTDRVIECVNHRSRPVVFVLWGKPAQTKRKLIDGASHLTIESPHPSPLSAHRGFFGSRPFSRVNAFLRDQGEVEIDWVGCQGCDNI